MIRMQKKAAEPVVDTNEVVNPEGNDEKETTGVSLLGIGGKQIKGNVKKGTKKRTPGEIRIQKGNHKTVDI